jgi:hypothetical protein
VLRAVIVGFAVTL